MPDVVEIVNKLMKFMFYSTVGADSRDSSNPFPMPSKQSSNFVGIMAIDKFRAGLFREKGYRTE